MLNIWKAGRGYKSSIKAGILGEDSDDESGSGSNDDDSEEEGEYQFFISASFSYRRLMFCWFPVVEMKEGIENRMEANLVNSRRVIYLTITNALNYEEAVHKLLKIELQEGQEVRTFFWLCCIDEKSNWSYLDWARQHWHDHWMLFPRTLVLYIICTYWRAFL